MGTSQTFSFYILPGPCQICVNSPILQLRKWRPRKVKSLGQGTIAGTRLSLDLDTDLSVPCFSQRYAVSAPSTPALLPQGSLMLQSPLGLLGSPRSQPSSHCSVWTPGPSAGLGQALPPLLLSLLPVISGPPRFATFTPHIPCRCQMLVKAAADS